MRRALDVPGHASHGSIANGIALARHTSAGRCREFRCSLREARFRRRLQTFTSSFGDWFLYTRKLTPGRTGNA